MNAGQKKFFCIISNRNVVKEKILIFLKSRPIRYWSGLVVLEGIGSSWAAEEQSNTIEKCREIWENDSELLNIFWKFEQVEVIGRINGNLAS